MINNFYFNVIRIIIIIIQGDDFGENSLAFFNNVEEPRDLSTSGIDRLEAIEGTGTTLEETQGGEKFQSTFTAKPIDIDVEEHFGMPVPDDDFGDFGTDHIIDG